MILGVGRREGEAPAEPLAELSCGSAGASPSRNRATLFSWEPRGERHERDRCIRRILRGVIAWRSGECGQLIAALLPFW